jgi:hypothetical protein
MAYGYRFMKEYGTIRTAKGLTTIQNERGLTEETAGYPIVQGDIVMFASNNGAGR